MNPVSRFAAQNLTKSSPPRLVTRPVVVSRPIETVPQPVVISQVAEKLPSDILMFQRKGTRVTLIRAEVKDVDLFSSVCS